MASENIKSIYETSNKNDKAMKETAGLESKLNHFRWIKKKYLNKLGDSLGQISYFKKKSTVLNNANHQMQQEKAHMV